MQLCAHWYSINCDWGRLWVVFIIRVLSNDSMIVCLVYKVRNISIILRNYSIWSAFIEEIEYCWYLLCNKNLLQYTVHRCTQYYIHVQGYRHALHNIQRTICKICGVLVIDLHECTMYTLHTCTYTTYMYIHYIHVHVWGIPWKIHVL